MKKRTKTKKFSITLKEPEVIKWMICQHCKKPIYGERTQAIGNPKKLTEWSFEPKSRWRKK